MLGQVYFNVVQGAFPHSDHVFDVTSTYSPCEPSSRISTQTRRSYRECTALFELQQNEQLDINTRLLHCAAAAAERVLVALFFAKKQYLSSHSRTETRFFILSRAGTQNDSQLRTLSTIEQNHLQTVVFLYQKQNFASLPCVRPFTFIHDNTMDADVNGLMNEMDLEQSKQQQTNQQAKVPVKCGSTPEGSNVNFLNCNTQKPKKGHTNSGGGD